MNMTCPKCGIEHSRSWTCEQARANAEAAGSLPKPVEILTTDTFGGTNVFGPYEEVKEASKTTFDRAAFKRDWWARKKGKK